MEHLKILNSKEKKQILSILERNYGFKEKLDYIFLRNNKNRIFLMSKDLKKIYTEKIRINSMGMYFSEIIGPDIHLSIEGSQLIGNKCNKNIVTLSEKEKNEWLTGIDIEKKTENSGFVIIKYNNEFLGCGKQTNTKILNYIPKNRRVKTFSNLNCSKSHPLHNGYSK